MRRIAGALALLVLAALARPAAAADLYRLDPEHTSIGFAVMHIGYARTLGSFLRAQGSFRFDEATRTLSELEATIETPSVFTAHERRDGHLRSADFLDADRHPTIRFVMREARASEASRGTVVGDLTIRGVTQPVELAVALNKIGPYPFGSNYVLGASARTTIRRSAFGMTYAVENGWVGDEVEITIEVEAIRQ